MVDKMTCMSCGQTKAWPDGFPSIIYAQCWDCAWKEHLVSKHPEILRRARREAKRLAKKKFLAEGAQEIAARLKREGLNLPEPS